MEGLAQAARGVPRRARHILHSLHTCLEDPSASVSKVAANRHLAAIGIDQDDLTGNDRSYLAVLARRGGFVSLETLAMQLGLDDVTLSGSNGLVEQFDQMGRRRFHMADVPANGDAAVDAGDAAENGATPEVLGVDDGDPGHEMTLHDVLAGSADDVNVAAARHMDWENALVGMDNRLVSILRETAAGYGPTGYRWEEVGIDGQRTRHGCYETSRWRKRVEKTD